MVRAAAASAKQALLGLAAARLGVPAASLTVKAGVVSGGGQTVTYRSLIGDKLFNATVVAANLNPGQGIAKQPSAYTLVGTSPPRIDIPDKVTGRFAYIQNIRVPGMLHARVVRPRGQANYGLTPTPLSIDKTSIAHLADVQIVQRGAFIAVVSPHEYNAIQAAALLKVKWLETPKLPSSGNMVSAMRATQTQDAVNAATGNVGTAFASAAKTVTASYSWSFNMHGPIGPSAAVAVVTPTSAYVICNTQGVHRLRGTRASLLGMPETSIRVQYVEGASAFGHCTSDDAAQGRGADLAARGQAGAPAVHALGRPRLRRYGPEPPGHEPLDPDRGLAGAEDGAAAGAGRHPGDVRVRADDR
jgi:CO/xanthine dehydrogenase Mo-binding subunit